MPRVRLPNAARFESSVARDELVSDSDIHFSRLSGLAPQDVDVLCDFTREEALLIVIRCPKRPARYFHGVYRPKPLTVKAKSDPATGLVALDNGTILVSDYDLMCVYRWYGVHDGYEKIVFTSPDPDRPELLPPGASALLEKVNWRLKSPFQHGAQDDYDSRNNPNLKLSSDAAGPLDRFLCFNLGTPSYYGNATLLKRGVYEPNGLRYPYDEQGKYRYESR